MGVSVDIWTFDDKDIQRNDNILFLWHGPVMIRKIIIIIHI